MAKITAGISLLGAGLKIRASSDPDPMDYAYCCYGCTSCPNYSSCGGCRSANPQNPFPQSCTVRACAIEKEIISCGLCTNLATCDKSLWTSYPQMRTTALYYQSLWLVTATEPVDKGNFLLYPNPAGNNVTLTCPSGVSGECRIFSLFGKMIKSDKIYGTTCEINISNLTKGDHIIQLFSQRKIIYSEKLIKH